MSKWLLIGLIVEYAIIGLVSLIEGRFIMGLYWISAIGLNVAVLLMAY